MRGARAICTYSASGLKEDKDNLKHGHSQFSKAAAFVLLAVGPLGHLPAARVSMSDTPLRSEDPNLRTSVTTVLSGNFDQGQMQRSPKVTRRKELVVSAGSTKGGAEVSMKSHGKVSLEVDWDVPEAERAKKYLGAKHYLQEGDKLSFSSDLLEKINSESDLKALLSLNVILDHVTRSDMNDSVTKLRQAAGVLANQLKAMHKSKTNLCSPQVLIVEDFKDLLRVKWHHYNFMTIGLLNTVVDSKSVSMRNSEAYQCLESQYTNLCPDLKALAESLDKRIEDPKLVLTLKRELQNIGYFDVDNDRFCPRVRGMKVANAIKCERRFDILMKINAILDAKINYHIDSRDLTCQRKLLEAWTDSFQEQLKSAPEVGKRYELLAKLQDMLCSKLAHYKWLSSGVHELPADGLQGADARVERMYAAHVPEGYNFIDLAAEDKEDAHAQKAPLSPDLQQFVSANVILNEGTKTSERLRMRRTIDTNDLSEVQRLLKSDDDEHGITKIKESLAAIGYFDKDMDVLTLARRSIQAERDWVTLAKLNALLDAELKKRNDPSSQSTHLEAWSSGLQSQTREFSRMQNREAAWEAQSHIEFELKAMVESKYMHLEYLVTGTILRVDDDISSYDDEERDRIEVVTGRDKLIKFLSYAYPEHLERLKREVVSSTATLPSTAEDNIRTLPSLEEVIELGRAPTTNENYRDYLSLLIRLVSNCDDQRSSLQLAKRVLKEYNYNDRSAEALLKARHHFTHQSKPEVLLCLHIVLDSMISPSMDEGSKRCLTEWTTMFVQRLEQLKSCKSIGDREKAINELKFTLSSFSNVKWDNLALMTHGKKVVSIEGKTERESFEDHADYDYGEADIIEIKANEAIKKITMHYEARASSVKQWINMDTEFAIPDLDCLFGNESF